MSDKNPISLIDKLARNRVFMSRFWKQQCFALNAETIIDKAVKLKTIGGLYGGAKKPTKFMCLLVKMLQMNLPKEMALQYLKARDYKYLTALTLMYLRLTVKGAEAYELLEPFYNDNRKLINKDFIGKHQIVHIDEWIDSLLTEEVVIGLVLPYLPKRILYEEQGLLEARISVLQQNDIVEEFEQKENQYIIRQKHNQNEIGDKNQAIEEQNDDQSSQ